MAITDNEFERAEKRLAALREAGHAVAARYDRRTSRVVVTLSNAVQLAFPTRLAEGLVRGLARKPLRDRNKPGGSWLALAEA
jgi:hypothetical protein